MAPDRKDRLPPSGLEVLVKGSLPPRRSLHARVARCSPRCLAGPTLPGAAQVTGSLSAMSVVFVDLDRTLLKGASGPVLSAALVAEGVVGPNRSLPGEGLLYALYD